MVENTYNKTSETSTVQETARSSSTTYEADHPVQFTGIVVTYNEARHLRDCLNSLAFCEQLIVIDLGSTDASVEIARQCGAEVIHHERVPVVEQIRAKALTHARKDWVVLIDPDERVSPLLPTQICQAIASNPKAGIVYVPWQFFFKGKKLMVTRWGRIANKAKPLVVNRNRVRIRAEVHRGYELLNRYERVNVPRQDDNYLIHYWMNGYKELLSKHWRYVSYEGEARYSVGRRFSWRRAIKKPIVELKRNLFNLGGLSGGWTGIFLSFFWAWYVLMRELSLWRYQRWVKVRGT